MEPGDTTSCGEDREHVGNANKYGSLMPKKHVVHQQQQYFDSADWQMNVHGNSTARTMEGRDGSSEASRLKPAYMMSTNKSGTGGGVKGKSKLSSSSLAKSVE